MTSPLPLILCFVVLLGIVTGTMVPKRWAKSHRSPPETRLSLIVALRQNPRGVVALEEALWSIADPRSPRYSQHLSPREVARLVRPSNATIATAAAWLASALGPGRAVLSSSGDYFHADCSVAEAERLMPGARYTVWRDEHGREAHRVADPGGFSLPAWVRAHVDLVAPTDSFLPSPRSNRRAVGKGEGLKTEPSTIRQLYGIQNFEASGALNNTQQVAAFLNNSFQPSDLQTFFAEYYPKGRGRTVDFVVGPNDAANPTVEASLDVQYIMAVGANVPTSFWSTAGQRPYPGGENEPFLTWLTGVVDAATSGTHPLPSVLSVSYADEEFVVDETFQARCDVEFMKIGAMGGGLFFGSGDNGVTGDKGNCPGGKFVPWWPASSPYVTGVGGTEAFTPQGASFSGGGFSNRYAIPAYQTAAVAAFKNKTNVAANYYNKSGAGFPDVAAVALMYWTVVGGTPDEVGGTSAATPTFAGIISMLNDARAAANKRPLGNINPLIYQHPEVFTDIKSGTNNGAGGCGVGGFTAVEGWDAVTGLGTPLFQPMMELAMSLP